MKKNLKKSAILIILIIIQSVIYIIAGSQKEYLHIDEVYSYGLSNYERVEIQDNEDFYDNWHTKEYFGDYLSIQEDEKGNYKPVYENQKNDVHPPIFYVLLRIAMECTGSRFTKWTGIILNIIVYAFITIFMYLILKKLLKEEKYSNEKASILAFMSSVILASVSNAIYIRMYAILTLNILITIFLHIKLLESEKINVKLLIEIGMCALIGVLTHYYYLFYLVVVYLIFLVKYLREKKTKELIYYTLTMAIAGITSLIIFPYSIQHMFFGYRGQGVISNLKSIKGILESVIPSIYNLNYYVFNNLLAVVVILIIGILIYNKILKKSKTEISQKNKQILKIMYLPTIFFFIMASISSPWKVLRYIVPVCGLIFVLTIYYLYKLLQNTSNEKISNIAVSVLLVLTLISPIIFKLEPELLYRDKKEIVQRLSDNSNIPNIYLYESSRGGFLDDLLLFSIVDESYIAKDIDYTIENIQKILKGKDISKGIFVFISENEKSDNILQTVKMATGLGKSEHLKKLNSCNVYYLSTF